jgi:signal transduction histidine kinase
MIKGLKRDFLLLLALFTGLLLSLFSIALFTTSYFIEEEVAIQRVLLEAKSLKLKYEENIELTTSHPNFKFYLGKDSLPEKFKEPILNASVGDVIVEVNEQTFYFYHFFIALEQEAYIIVDKEGFQFFEKLSKEILFIFYLIIPLTLVSVIYIWWLLARKIVKPLITLTNAIQVGTMEDPHIPKHILNYDNEVGILARRLNSAYQALLLAISREKEFTRDVSHELRTPVSVIMNELLLCEGKDINKTSQSLLKEQVNIINNRIDVLFALARAESVEKQYVSMLTVIEDAILSIYKLLESSNFKIEVDVAPQVKLFTNENLLSLMISNLIENAVKYASDNQMVIKGSARHITLSNRTSRLVNDEILNRCVTQGEGLGQGLYLIKRIVESLNGKIDVEVNNGEFKLDIRFND